MFMYQILIHSQKQDTHSCFYKIKALKIFTKYKNAPPDKISLLKESFSGLEIGNFGKISQSR